MDSYRRKQFFKFLLLMMAVGIGAFILIYSNSLADKLKYEEYKRMQLWSEATKILASPESTEEGAINLVLDVISQNTTIPVLLCDSLGNILFHRNVTQNDENDTLLLRKQYRQMVAKGNRIDIILDGNDIQYLYYSDSSVIRQLSMFPFVQLTLVGLFIILAYTLFSGSRRAEQNRVWAGMAKETAHQLGTPTSSLMGWVDYLKMKDISPDITAEMSKDLARLQNVADRFSKIGSKPDRQPVAVFPLIENLASYLSRRQSGKVHISVFPQSDTSLVVRINTILLEWALENVIKNALDAINGEGRVGIYLHQESNRAVIDVSDNGKGMRRHQVRHIFDAGFTTKKRGWGLGLTLTKRIIEEYHKGRIFVKESEVGKGTTIRIMLPLK
jgi:signal transduction histidine kinase